MSRPSPLRSVWETVSDVAAAHRAVSRVTSKLVKRAPLVLGRRSALEPTPEAPNARGAREFLAALRREVQRHPGVNHPFLARLRHVPFTRQDYRVFGLQHYSLVGTFTTYLEHLLVKAPSSEAKSWIAKVLVDEYGEGSEGKDHAELYREFLRSTGSPEGEEYETPLHREVTGFVAEHLRICRDEPFLVGLGAVGPGHEWSIPRMFPPIIAGLTAAGFEPEEIRYFTLHVLQDEDHGSWLEEALATFAQEPEAQAQIRRGALLSLAARARFWSAVQDQIVRYRQPENVHLRSPSRASSSAAFDYTLREWKRKVGGAGITAASHT